MRERPILFTAPMVRAIVAGTKTQTRRVVKPQPVELPDFNRGRLSYNVRGSVYRAWNPAVMDPSCPYGQPGDRLWVRETFQRFTDDGEIIYKADPQSFMAMNDLKRDECLEARWRPSIHMPRWASRILLEITAVRVERLQSISEEDCIDEGVFRKTGETPIGDLVETATGGELIYAQRGQAALAYRDLWESINGPGSWAANPWVWVVKFRRVAQ